MKGMSYALNNPTKEILYQVSLLYSFAYDVSHAYENYYFR
jgi:hypothetical protein